MPFSVKPADASARRGRLRSSLLRAGLLAAALTACSSAAFAVTFGGTWQSSGAARLRASVVGRRAEAEADTSPQDEQSRQTRRIPGRADGATLRARVWDMLGLAPSAKKDEIRAAYKEYVRTNHPDVNPGADQEQYAVKLQKLTAEYNRVMDMNEDEFWLEAFDTRITRMATKRVDGQNLNPWERRFRQWARKENLLEVEELSDDIDCSKKAELYFDACDEDPTAEGCETRYDEAPKARVEKKELVDVIEPRGGSAETIAADSVDGAQIFGYVIAAVGSFIGLAFLAIIVKSISG